MSVRVLFFATIAQQQGTRERTMPHHEGMILADVLNTLEGALPDVCLIAVNQEQQQSRELTLHNGDEIAIMPPFSGG